MQRLMWRRKSRAVLALGAVLFAVTICGSARAQVTITYPGNGSFGENVLFTNNPPDGFHVVGVLNSENNNLFDVNFDSIVDKMHGDGGQARLEPAPDNPAGLRLHQVCVSLDPGFGFTEYIFNAYRDGLKGTVPFTVDATFVALSGGAVGTITETFTINNGSNFFDVKADSGFLLTQVCFETPNLADTVDTEFGLIDLRQNRIVGAQAVSIVPEGSSLAMLGLGGMPILAMLFRRRIRSKGC